MKTFLLILLVVRLSVSAPVKVRPFRRADDVQDFCLGDDGHHLHCYEVDFDVDPESCALGEPAFNCTYCDKTSKDSSQSVETNIIMLEDSEEATRSQREDSVKTAKDSKEEDEEEEEESDPCLCATGNDNLTTCSRCNLSAIAVTTAALDLKTTMANLELYMRYVWLYLYRRAPCVYEDPMAATELAIQRLQLRLDEITPVGTTFNPQSELCGVKISTFDQVESTIDEDAIKIFAHYYLLVYFHPPGIICHSDSAIQVNPAHTNPPKRRAEVTRVMKVLKRLLEAYSCVTRVAYGDSLCCHVSRCEVVPRLRQCLNILDLSALQEIAKDVIGNIPSTVATPSFIDNIAKHFGASFDCRS